MTTAAEHDAAREGDNRDDQGPAGALYVMSNQATGNSVAIFDRAADGSLAQQGTFPTGGLGIGGVTDPLDSLLSQGSLALSADHRFLFAVEAGSNEVSVLAVEADKLVPVDRVPTGGTTPVSLTTHENLLYVLNREDPALGHSTVTGFTVDVHGKLTPLVDSTQPLVGGPGATPAQVSFTPDGTRLVVAERSENVVDVLPVDAYGRAGPPVQNASNGAAPFGFTFAGKDLLVVSELSGATSSYRVGENGTLTVVSGSVPTNAQGACWAVTNSPVDPRYAYVSNAVSGSVAGYRIDDAGALSLLSPDGRTAVLVDSRAAIDSAVSGDGQFLYVLTGGFSETAESPVLCNPMGISAFRIEADGKLTAIGNPQVDPPVPPVVDGLAPGTQGIVAT